MAYHNKMGYVPATRPGCCIPASVLAELIAQGRKAPAIQLALPLMKGETILGRGILCLLVYVFC